MPISARITSTMALMLLAACSTRGPAAVPGTSNLAFASPTASLTPSASPAPPTALHVAPPSGTATMLCGTEIRGDVMKALGLRAKPTTRTTWTNRLYTCTYTLPQGALVLSVKESGSLTAGREYYDATRASLKNAKTLSGMQGLGQPGYETPDGVVVLLKDDKTLRVDATQLPATLGPHKLSPADLAYEIATDILGCWNEK